MRGIQLRGVSDSQFVKEMSLSQEKEGHEKKVNADKKY